MKTITKSFLKTIEKETFHIGQLKTLIESRDNKTVSVKDIIKFYRKFDPDIKRPTVDWRIHNLMNEGILERIGNGLYTLGKRTVFQPQIDPDLKGVYEDLAKEYPYLSFSVWTTKWLNTFMIHQPARYFTLIEVEQDGMEPVFYMLKDKYDQVYINPSADTMDKYISGRHHSKIVTRLISEAPVQGIEGITVPTLEKILVDLYCNRILFGAFQGKELENIYANASETYVIDRSKLLRYASRRGKKEEIKTFIKHIDSGTATLS